MKRNSEIDLGGDWLFRLDPDKLGEHYPERLDIPWSFDARWMNPDYDDRTWSPIRVPSCWQEEGYNYNGVAWYRKWLPEGISNQADRRVWLHFSGVDYFSDVWLNEHYLGSHEGYFSAFQYEITPYLNSERNLLVVRVDSPNDIRAKERQYGQLKGLLKGALQRWDVNNPEVNPGGIWNHIAIYTTGPGAIQSVDLKTMIHRLPDAQSRTSGVPASVMVQVGLAFFYPTTMPGTASIRVRLRKPDQEEVAAEAVGLISPVPGPTVWPLSLELDQAQLWYTWDLGEPQLYEAEIALLINGEISDLVFQTFGFRKIERRQGWGLYLNGLPFYQRGANYLSDQFLSSMDAARYRRDIELFREANLNTVHPFAVIEKQTFYDQCDRAGLLVYQDFPMWLTMDNTSDLVRRAEQQLRELVAQFGHHPSIGIWNFGSQPSVANFEKLGAHLTRLARELDPFRISHQANAMIDRHGRETDPVDDYKWHRKRLKEFQENYDWRVDTHQYYGWYWADLKALKSVPLEDLELVTEYGAQALPAKERLQEIIPSQALFPPDWPYYTQRCFQPEVQFDHIPQPTSLEQMIHDSQTYQARFIQYHTEYYRIHKGSPNQGAHYFCFNDCWPAITWSVVDYHRAKKPGFYALQKAMAPLQAFLEFRDELAAGQDNAPAIWVVNDFPWMFGSLTLRYKIIEGSNTNLVTKDYHNLVAEAASILRIGSCDYTFSKEGNYLVELSLEDQGKVIAANSYEVTVE